MYDTQGSKVLCDAILHCRICLMYIEQSAYQSRIMIHFARRLWFFQQSDQRIVDSSSVPTPKSLLSIN